MESPGLLHVRGSSPDCEETSTHFLQRSGSMSEQDEEEKNQARAAVEALGMSPVDCNGCGLELAE